MYFDVVINRSAQVFRRLPSAAASVVSHYVATQTNVATLLKKGGVQTEQRGDVGEAGEDGHGCL